MATYISSSEATDDSDSIINADFLNHIATIRAIIQQHYTSLIAAIKQKESQLLQELSSIEQTYIQEYQRYLTTFEELEKTKQLTMETIFSEDIQDLRENIVNQVDERLKSIKLKIESKKIEFEWDTRSANAVIQIGRLITLERSASLSIDYKMKVNPAIKTCKQGTGPGDMNRAWGVATDSDTNNIYVVDHMSSRVCVFSSEGEFLFEFAGNTNSTVKMSNPIGIAIHENKLFVSQYSSHCIQIYNQDGTYMQQFGSQGTGKNQFNYPYGIAISPISGDIYVCDNNNNRVHILSRDYRLKSFLGMNQLQSLRDVKLAFDITFILDGNSPCVHIYDSSNKLLRSVIHRTGNGYTISDGCCCIFVDKDNNIILSDYGTHSVLVFSYTGDIIHQIGKTAKLFTNPFGVMIDAHDRLIVVNQQKDACIQIF